MKKHRIYISSGDINGISTELILRNHDSISKWCDPIYCIHKDILLESARLLSMDMPTDMVLNPPGIDSISIQSSIVSAKSGAYSFASFVHALDLALQNNAPLVTLPIHKYAWSLAKIKHAGHTEYLRSRFQKNAIMMLGCEDMLVALYTDHIPLREVANMISTDSLVEFFLDLYKSLLHMGLVYGMQGDSNAKEALLNNHIENLQNIAIKESAINAQMVSRLLSAKTGIAHVVVNNAMLPSRQILVLGLNPHAGDNGVIGHEDSIIKEAIDIANEAIGGDIFIGPVSPDSAFIPINRDKYRIFVAMYHDSGLAPLKALYFDKSINVSLNIPVIRVSPDHGVCFEKAYKMSSGISAKSYLECFRFLLKDDI